MKPGIKISLLCILIGMQFPIQVLGMERDKIKTQEVLKQEAYYHFFLQEYLTSATRLKILEAKSFQAKNDSVLNETRLLLGSLYLSWGMHRPATELFYHLVQFFPAGLDRNQVLLLIERLQFSRSLYQATVETFKLLTPEEDFLSMDHAQYLAGMSYYSLGSYGKGVQTLENISSKSPYFPFAHLALAKSYFQLKETEKSFMAFNELNNLKNLKDPLSKAFLEKVRLTQGFLFLETDQFEKARQVFSSISQTSPFYPDALFGLGWAYFNQGLYLEALMVFQEQTHRFPNHPYSMEALTSIGHCYSNLKAHQKALESYEKAVQSYSNQQQKMRNLRTRIRDKELLDIMIRDHTSKEKEPLADFQMDKTISFWMEQYQELVYLEEYLDHKIKDINVFTLLLNHREKVFKENLPSIQNLFRNDPAKEIRIKGNTLLKQFEEGSQREALGIFASHEEASQLNQWAHAKKKSSAIQEALGKSKNSELMEEWTQADRWLKVAHGELLWTLETEIPGRKDDLRREMKFLLEDIKNLKKKKDQLISSIPSLEGKMNEFRKQIEKLKPALKEKRKRVVQLREKLLHPLQALLVQGLEKRIGKIEEMSAKARFSQIQIVDATRQ